MPKAPAHWGDMRQHVFYGALYHFFVMAMNGRYRNFRPHRDLTVGQEFRLYLRAPPADAGAPGRTLGRDLADPASAAFPITSSSCSLNMTRASARIPTSPR